MPKKCPAEVRERVVRLTPDRLKDHPSLWAPCRDLAPSSTLALKRCGTGPGKRSTMRENGPFPPVKSHAIWKVRYDIVNQGKITLRYGNKMLHLGLGRAHERTDVIALIKNDHATVIDTHGTVLG